MALGVHDPGGPERDAGLDRLYRHAGEELPRAEIDDAIRAAARKAVGARPQALGTRARRWGVPISIAAVVVVSVSLITLMREEGAGRLDESYAPAPAEPKAPAAALPVEAQDKKAQDRAEPVGRARGVSPQAPPAPAERAGAASAPDDLLGSRQLTVPSSAPHKPAEEAAEAPHAPAEAERAAVRQAVPAQEALGKKKTETPAADAPRSPAATMRSAPLRADQRPMTSSSIETRERSLTDDQLQSLLKELEKAAPDSWLKTIERLRREGRHTEADRLLVEFKRRFPEHPVARQEPPRAR